jgi:PAS domain S-box-containing protein
MSKNDIDTNLTNTPNQWGEDSTSFSAIENAATFLSLLGENVDLRRQVHLLQSLPALIIVFDLSGRICFASQSVIEFLGLSNADDIEGTLFWDLITEESKSTIERAFANAIAEKAEAEDILLNDGRDLMIHILNDERGGRESILSVRGSVYSFDGAPECVCSMRVVSHRSQIDRNSDELVSVASDDNHQEASEKSSDENKEKHTVNYSKRARSNDQDVSFKKVRSNSFNQVSDQDSSK